jgi:hypothetical protein
LALADAGLATNTTHSRTTSPSPTGVVVGGASSADAGRANITRMRAKTATALRE